MKGRVTMVSPASARDPANGQEHYIAYVNLLPTEAAIVQQNGMTLVPGMPAEVFVSTQERTVASYLSKPFTDQMNRAFRER
jgi:HlyD family secretion protein